MRFASTDKDAKTIAAELDVRYLVEGSVRRAGDHLRITAQLIDAGNDETIWAGNTRGSVSEVFEMQERLARTIVHALALRLTPDEDRRLSSRPLDSIPAYECYLQARQEVWRWRKDSIDHGVRLLRTALEMIGDNAVLYAALGFAHLQYREAGIDLSDAPLDAAEACARRLETLDPRRPPRASSAVGSTTRADGIQEAVRELKAALHTNPNNPDTLLLLINCYVISGRVPEARPLLERLLSIDPLTPLTRCMPAFADLVEGRAEAAVAPYRQMLEMDPQNPMARLFYVWVLLLNGQTDRARETIDGFPSDARDTMPGRLALFLHHAATGDRAAATATISAAAVAPAVVTDVFPRFLADGYASGRPDRRCAGVAAACRRSRLHQLSIPRPGTIRSWFLFARIPASRQSSSMSGNAGNGSKRSRRSSVISRVSSARCPCSTSSGSPRSVAPSSAMP